MSVQRFALPRPVEQLRPVEPAPLHPPYLDPTAYHDLHQATLTAAEDLADYLAGRPVDLAEVARRLEYSAGRALRLPEGAGDGR